MAKSPKIVSIEEVRRVIGYSTVTRKPGFEKALKKAVDHANDIGRPNISHIVKKVIDAMTCLGESGPIYHQIDYSSRGHSSASNRGQESSFTGFQYNGNSSN